MNPPPETPPGSEYKTADGTSYTVGPDGYIIIAEDGTEFSPYDMLPVPKGTSAKIKRLGVFPDHIVDAVLAAS